ncbi:uncharacterized protein BXZ73DRAFT_111354 [Epithele typhae]|uniref:uncharacterized protein n=1 Tax=Epithele typhae TaxID=378194 RepID=UPI002007DB23|nr:uncharacterized protein BXZ73DRAFT_111354 [Epithele typhae]KAH9903892.1 hypothetical protein BXZ73DRAFT_111354 [Epithele typhae]
MARSNHQKTAKKPAATRSKKGAKSSVPTGVLVQSAAGDVGGDTQGAVTEEAGDDQNNGEKKKTTWTIPLSHRLITSVIENKEIKNGLYPEPGPNPSMKNGGGKRKTEFHAKLATIVFADDLEYGAAFNAEVKADPKNIVKWGLKVKNRLKGLEKETRDYLTELGQTGAGIEREEDIDMSQNNSFTNRWAQIQEKFLFLWDMKGLINARPNVIPVGIANGQDNIDSMRSKSLPVAVDPHNSDDDDSDLIRSVAAACEKSGRSGADLAPARTSEPLMTKDTATVASESGKKTSTRSGVSTPAAKGTTSASGKKLKNSDQFNNFHLTDAATQQKLYDAQIARSMVDKEKAKVKILKTNGKYELLKLRLDFKHQRALEKQKQEMQMQMAMIKQGMHPGGVRFGAFSTDPGYSPMSRSAMSHNTPNFDILGPSTATIYRPLDGQAPIDLLDPLAAAGVMHTTITSLMGDLAGVGDSNIVSG